MRAEFCCAQKSCGTLIAVDFRLLILMPHRRASLKHWQILDQACCDAVGRASVTSCWGIWVVCDLRAWGMGLRTQ